jgi:hypothetical protein
MHRIAAAKIGVLASVVTMWSVAVPVAHASPEDPYGGEDWVALTIAPFAPGMPVRYGVAGTQDDAVQTAMDFCNKDSAGHPCYVASTIEYGCVAVAINHRSGAFTAGRGPDEASALQDAANKTVFDADPDGFATGGVMCSTPSTPPQ